MADRFAFDELHYTGRVVEVHRVGVAMPDGAILARDLVRCRPAVTILPILDDGSMVLIRNRRYAVNENLLELPAGGVEVEEDPISAARRELLEETGFRAGHLECLGSFYTAPGALDEKIHAFLATRVVCGAAEPEPYEQITVETYRPERLRQMVASGEIHDAKTIATLGLYWLGPGPTDAKTQEA
jgi:ADP-ribose pyrophosphatase